MNTTITTPFDTETEQWENGALGRDEAHIAVAPTSNALAIDDALGLQMISIRLPKELIEAFKAIATVNEMGYQPLMRSTLQRFADSELKRLAMGYLDKTNAQKAVTTVRTAPLKMAA
jgi:predicted DNA binding CopG/RHH family protein